MVHTNLTHSALSSHSFLFKSLRSLLSDDSQLSYQCEAELTNSGASEELGVVGASVRPSRKILVY